MLRLAAVSATAIGLAACSGGTDEGTMPTITSFTAAPAMIAAGGTTTFTWAVVDADTITITGGGQTIESTMAMGNQTSDPINATTTFTLTATNEDGSVTSTAEVTVMGAPGGPTVDNFTANPTGVNQGESSVLTWMTTDATTVNITAGGASVVADGAADGTFTVTPDADTTYTLIASDADGNDSTPSTVTITVTAPGMPVVNTFTASPMAVDPGMATTLSWTAANANSVIVTDDQGNELVNGSDLTGSVMDSPTVDTTYTITVSDGTNMATDTVTVTVNQPMGASIQSFTATPMMAVTGQNVDLAWATMDADSIAINDGATDVHTSTNAAGTFQVTMGTADQTYTLTALNANGNATAMVTVTFSMAAPVVNNFDASPSPGPLGGLTTLSWDVAAADTIDIADGVGTPIVTATTAAAGSIDVTLANPSNDYVLTATNQFGNVMQTITVMADNGTPTINAFTVSPDIGTDPLTVTITYDVLQARTLEVLANGVALTNVPFVANGMPQDATGSFMMTISASTNFELVVGNGAGTDNDIASAIVAAPGGIEIEPNDTATAGQSLMGMTPQVAGTISVGDDEDWYAITVPAGGFVRAATSDGAGGCPFDTVLSLFDVDGTTQIARNDDFGGSRCSLLEPSLVPALTNLPAGTYYIRVESFGTNTGNYVLDVTIGTPGCGNTVLEAGEQCDDGNTTPGDQCDAMCMFEPDHTFSSPGAAATFTTNIVNVGDIQIAAVNVTAVSYIRAETFEVASTMTCDNADSELFLLDSTGAALGSDDLGGVGNCSKIDENDGFARLDVGSYFVIVTEDNNDDAIPALELVLEGVAADICGNGVTELGAGENCDDGNTTPGDGCSDLCQNENAQAFTAPGAQVILQTPIVNAGDQPIVNITVTVDAYLRAETLVDSVNDICGVDTIITVNDSQGVQALRDDDGGTGACSLIDENDGVLAAGNYTLIVEEFGNNAAIPVLDLILEGIAANVCGNGIVEAGLNEACDDGNTTPGDGCDATCQFEGVTSVPESEPNGDIASADDSTIASPGTILVSGTVDPMGDEDYWSFTIPAGATRSISAQTHQDPNDVNGCPLLTTADTRIYLYDSAGVELGNNDDGGAGRCSFIDGTSDAYAMNLAPGTYYINVRHFSLTSAATVPYFMTMTLQ